MLVATLLFVLASPGSLADAQGFNGWAQGIGIPGTNNPVIAMANFLW